ncbi:MAG TPA: hypothetical protein VF503_21490 [Sphingobium sp.]|uniref:hypothetical protein n=1 Tax=Sphingobium sp. TaxID=1912891 RepID=UPI002ED069B4
MSSVNEEAKKIVAIANRLTGLPGNEDSGVPISVIRACAAVVNGVGLAKVLPQSAQPSPGGDVRALAANVRYWPYYPIEMPITAEGFGPASIGKDAAKLTYEVWDQTCLSHGSFNLLPDAINEAMRLSATTPATGAEAVAVIGKDWQLLWASTDALSQIVERTGIKIGSKLYAHPPATPTPERLERAKELLASAYSQFKFYERQHIAKTESGGQFDLPGKARDDTLAKAQVNREFAERIAAFLSDPANEQRAGHEGEAEEVRPFVREERYIVIKRTHFMNEREEQEFRKILDEWTLPTIKCVVVEGDWPEYETVWQMIADRIAARKGDE